MNTVHVLMADVRVNCGCFMRLDIRHWEMLKAIADLGTLRNAASALGITQSALSHRLAEAERRLGSPLFDREGRQLRLAKAGIAMTQTVSTTPQVSPADLLAGEKALRFPLGTTLPELGQAQVNPVAQLILQVAQLLQRSKYQAHLGAIFPEMLVTLVI